MTARTQGDLLRSLRRIDGWFTVGLSANHTLNAKAGGAQGFDWYRDSQPYSLMVEQRTDVPLEVPTIEGVDLGVNPQRLAARRCDGDRSIDALLRGDAAEESEVGTRVRMKLDKIEWQTVMHGADPACVG